RANPTAPRKPRNAPSERSNSAAEENHDEAEASQTTPACLPALRSAATRPRPAARHAVRHPDILVSRNRARHLRVHRRHARRHARRLLHPTPGRGTKTAASPRRSGGYPGRRTAVLTGDAKSRRRRWGTAGPNASAKNYGFRQALTYTGRRAHAADPPAGDTPAGPADRRS